jgi:hypothetical protein
MDKAEKVLALLRDGLNNKTADEVSKKAWEAIPAAATGDQNRPITRAMAHALADVLEPRIRALLEEEGESGASSKVQPGQDAPSQKGDDQP